MAQQLNEIQHEIGEWAGKTFEHDAKSIAAHLLDEAASLYYACGGNRPMAQQIVGAAPFKYLEAVGDQVADVLILDLTLADYADLLAEDLVGEKMKINRKRTWGPRNVRGLTEHIVEGESNA